MHILPQRYTFLDLLMDLCHIQTYSTQMYKHIYSTQCRTLRAKKYMYYFLFFNIYNTRLVGAYLKIIISLILHFFPTETHRNRPKRRE